MYLVDAREFGSKVYYGEEEIVLNEEQSVKLGLIKENLFFLDPVKQIIKPQSQLDLLAIREVMKN